jgi:adenosylhomocysteine nucleosidase
MIGVLFATHPEAQPYLARSGAKEVAAAPFALFELGSPPAVIIISGMGKVSAALAAQILIRERHCDRILNAGVCGALVDGVGLTPGNIFRISAASEGPSGPGVPVDAIRCAGALWRNLPAARLVTVEQPVFEAAERQRLAAWGALVDMEGAVVARVAQLYGIPWDMIKGITDTAGDGERINLHRNLATVSEAVAAHLSNGISTYATPER